MKAEQQNIKRLLNTAIAILKKVNIEILDAHLKCCVLHADDRERETKINEISEVLKKALK